MVDDGKKQVYFEADRAAGPHGKTLKLLNGIPAASATSDVYNGQWFLSGADCKYANVEVFGTFVGTVTIEGSNVDDPTNTPPSGYSPPAIGASTLTAPGVVALKTPMRWVRAVVTGFTSGTVSAYYHGAV